MSWKSNAGLKVLENKIDTVEPSKQMKIISALINNEDDQMITPHETVYVVVEFLLNEQDITTNNIEELEKTGGSFDFLKDKEEKTYKPTDGDPL